MSSFSTPLSSLPGVPVLGVSLPSSSLRGEVERLGSGDGGVYTQSSGSVPSQLLSGGGSVAPCLVSRVFLPLLHTRWPPPSLGWGVTCIGARCLLFHLIGLDSFLHGALVMVLPVAMFPRYLSPWLWCGLIGGEVRCRSMLVASFPRGGGGDVLRCSGSRVTVTFSFVVSSVSRFLGRTDSCRFQFFSFLPFPFTWVGSVALAHLTPPVVGVVGAWASRLCL